MKRGCRVEEGRGIGTDWSATRFPSPLIKPDVPVSSIRLSDRLHQLAHGSGPRCTSRSRRTPKLDCQMVQLYHKR